MPILTHHTTRKFTTNLVKTCGEKAKYTTSVEKNLTISNNTTSELLLALQSHFNNSTLKIHLHKYEKTYVYVCSFGYYLLHQKIENNPKDDP